MCCLAVSSRTSSGKYTFMEGGAASDVSLVFATTPTTVVQGSLGNALKRLPNAARPVESCQKTVAVAWETNARVRRGPFILALPGVPRKKAFNGAAERLALNRVQAIV